MSASLRPLRHGSVFIIQKGSLKSFLIGPLPARVEAPANGDKRLNELLMTESFWRTGRRRGCFSNLPVQTGEPRGGVWLVARAPPSARWRRFPGKSELAKKHTDTSWQRNTPARHWRLLSLLGCFFHPSPTMLGTKVKKVNRRLLSTYWQLIITLTLSVTKP